MKEISARLHQAAEMVIANGDMMCMDDVTQILEVLSDLKDIDTIVLAHLVREVYNSQPAPDSVEANRADSIARLVTFTEALACLYGKMGSN